MIITALSRYYEQLRREHPDKISQPGWCSRLVSYELVLSEEGDLIGLTPRANDDGKGAEMMVPEQVKRAYGIAANFLCDNSTYILGVDDKGKPERSIACFEAARELHHRILDGVDSSRARAILAFFDQWRPEAASSNELVEDADGALFKGNLVFSVMSSEYLTTSALDDLAIQEAWERFYAQGSDDDAVMTCLATGQKGPIARLHPSIKGVYGAQSSGATLIGFNAPSFESYGHEGEQGRNAPVNKQVTQAYAAALNYLLADPQHCKRMGETTVVYWSERADEANCKVLSDCVGDAFFQNGKTDAQGQDALLDGYMKRLSVGLPIEGTDPDSRFYVLGLAPNAARLSVQFFFQSDFGTILENVRKHYQRLEIDHAPYEREYVTPLPLLREIARPGSKKPVEETVLCSALLRTILMGGRYPEALYENAILRIRATQDNPDQYVKKVTRGRVAIIKAYLLNNRQRSDREVTVSLNEERMDTPYVLGRLFSVMENAQETAARLVDKADINATIKAKYYDTACTRPQTVFPVIDRLCDKYIDKLRRSSEGKGAAVSLDKMRGELWDRVDELPKQLTLEQQGDFILGYHHQTRVRYQSRKAASQGSADTSTETNAAPAVDTQEA